MKEVRCPRCGKNVSSFGTKTINDRKYLFAYHGNRPCYLGPYDSYVHAERLWGIGLSNVSDADLEDMLMEIFSRLLHKVRRAEGEKKEKMVKELNEMLKQMHKKLQDV
ncbi:MAG: hypothetical protein B9J98_03495 [Candidatus Terraquivivens tikiterensis]|uniref:Uncharacterized protein n=1 Tax=Candidatus Terraquivivens tikiterensis TaxID=1980982 RepID=A0A2R7Y5Z6_9ARCH|nr:MAG: hypothetical protein B9J98_03495 [Candidatus Terraquivivens tikiterensis]